MSAQGGLGMNQTNLKKGEVEQPELIYRQSLAKIENEIYELHGNREIWQFFNKELPKQPSYSIIHDTLTRWYVDTQAACVRRIASTRTHDKLSLGTLLQSLSRHDNELNTVRHGVSIGSAEIVKDAALLDVQCAKVSRWADENVAHLGRKQSVDPTFNDLDGALNVIGELFTKYNLFITGTYVLDVKPIIAEDWMAPFRHAWI
jgi:hypothetical protein